MTEEINLFENLPFDEGMQIYIEYLQAKSVGNLKEINKLFNEHPDMFQPKTLALAKSAAKKVAKLNNDKRLLALLNNKNPDLI